MIFVAAMLLHWGVVSKLPTQVKNLKCGEMFLIVFDSDFKKESVEKQWIRCLWKAITHKLALWHAKQTVVSVFVAWMGTFKPKETYRNRCHVRRYSMLKAREDILRKIRKGMEIMEWMKNSLQVSIWFFSFLKSYSVIISYLFHKLEIYRKSMVSKSHVCWI